MDIETTRVLERLVVTGCAPLLIYIGYQLLLRGAAGELKLSARPETLSGRIVNILPGILCFVLATSIGGYVMFNTVKPVPVAGATNSSPAKNGEPGKDSVVHLEYLGGPDAVSPTILDAYAKVGFGLQGLLRHDKMPTKDQLKEVLKKNLAILAKPISDANFKDLQTIEQEVREGASPKKLQHWRTEYLKR